MKQVRLFGIPRKDIEAIYLNSQKVSGSIKTIIKKVSDKVDKLGFCDIGIFTIDSFFVICVSDRIEEVEEFPMNGRGKYISLLTRKEETSKDFSPSKHTSAFFSFFGF